MRYMIRKIIEDQTRDQFDDQIESDITLSEHEMLLGNFDWPTTDTNDTMTETDPDTTTITPRTDPEGTDIEVNEFDLIMGKLDDTDQLERGDVDLLTRSSDRKIPVSPSNGRVFMIVRVIFFPLRMIIKVTHGTYHWLREHLKGTIFKSSGSMLAKVGSRLTAYPRTLVLFGTVLVAGGLGYSFDIFETARKWWIERQRISIEKETADKEAEKKRLAEEHAKLNLSVQEQAAVDAAKAKELAQQKLDEEKTRKELKRLEAEKLREEKAREAAEQNRLALVAKQERDAKLREQRERGHHERQDQGKQGSGDLAKKEFDIALKKAMGLQMIFTRIKNTERIDLISEAAPLYREGMQQEKVIRGNYPLREKLNAAARIDQLYGDIQEIYNNK